MATYTNKNGTASADTLTYNKAGTYHANAGNDTIKIDGGNGVVVYTDSGYNSITVIGGSGHTIKVAANNADSDKQNGVEKLTINGANQVEGYLGAGKDEINLFYSDGKKSTGTLSQLHGGDWGDKITVGNGAKGYQLYGDAGDDIFTINNGSNIVCWGGAANDTFNVTGGTGIKLRGGDSADVYNISDKAAAVDMQLGYGNDVVNVIAGDNHTIKGNLGINTINLKAGTGHVITADIDQAASQKAGKEVGYGVDKLFLEGTATHVTANLGDGKDVVTLSRGYGHKLYTEGWGDTINISGTAANSILDAGEGDDIINISGGNNNIVEAGAGNDTIEIKGGTNTVIRGGAGKDKFVVSGGKNITIVGGLGIDDFEFSNLNANTSYILDLTNDPKGDREVIVIEGAATDFSVEAKGNDVVLTNEEGGSLTLKGWSDQSCARIVFGDDSVYSKERLLTTLPEVVINSQADVMKYFLTSMDLSVETGLELVDEAVNYASMGQYKTLKDLVEEFKYACINYSTPDTYNEFLKKYCSIDLTNEDTGAITGADAGGAKVKTSKTVTGIPEGMKWSDLTYDASNIIMAYDWETGKLDRFYGVKVNGLTFYWDQENWDDLKVNSEVLEQIVAGVTGLWGEKSIYLSGISYGMDFDDPYCYLPTLPDGSKGIQIVFENEDSDALAYVEANDIKEGELKGTILEKLCINTKYYNKLFEDMNGSSEASGLGLDRLIAHEMVHGVMFANVEGMGTMPVFIQEGLAEVVHGIDDYRPEAIEVLVDSSLRRTIKDEQGHTTYKDQEDTLNDVFDLTNPAYKDGDYSYAGGYTLLRYFAKQVYDKAKGGSAMVVADGAINATADGFGGAAADAAMGSDYSSLMTVATGFADTNGFEAGALENAAGYEALSTEDKLKITGNC